MSHTKEAVMAQAQVFASAWSLVGSRFDNGDAGEVAYEEKEELAAMVDGVLRERDYLLAFIKRLRTMDAGSALLFSMRDEVDALIAKVGAA